MDEEAPVPAKLKSAILRPSIRCTVISNEPAPVWFTVPATEVTSNLTSPLVASSIFVEPSNAPNAATRWPTEMSSLVRPVVIRACCLTFVDAPTSP